jgi:hypothetical protein
MVTDDVSNTTQVRAHCLQRSTRSDAAQVRIPIGGIFLKVIKESKTCQIYKSFLYTINSVVRTPSRVSKKVAYKYIINKVILNIGLLLFRRPEPV